MKDTSGMPLVCSYINETGSKMEFLDFPNPFGVKLRGDNRWASLSRLIPWEEFEHQYAALFNSDGAVAYPFRMALGAEILKERLGVTDRELVEQISENPYLQYFLGLPRYTLEAPFDASTLVHFRKRLSAEMLKAINERIALQGLAGAAKNSQKENEPPPPPASHEVNPPKLQREAKPPQGKLLMDATCAPEDIRFPNDLGLLNEAREVTEAIVDCLWESRPESLRQSVKPKTYRKTQIASRRASLFSMPSVPARCLLRNCAGRYGISCAASAGIRSLLCS